VFMTMRVLCLVLALLVPQASAPGAGPGPIIAVGGGGTTDAIVARTLALAGGKEASVAVLPQSSEAKDAGDSSVKMWLDAGAKQAFKVEFADRAKAKALLESASLIWMPGGDQNRFMKVIAGTGLDDVIRARHRAGIAVGGTSAGAAVLSQSMITGDADLQSLTAHKTAIAHGLGLLTDVIVDQHFLRRQRQNRLMSAVLERPRQLGVGIDEATAAIFHNGKIDVLGRSAVVVIDARRAHVETIAADRPVAASDVQVTILRDGMSLAVAPSPGSGSR
jgi:cyanophycinase